MKRYFATLFAVSMMISTAFAQETAKKRLQDSPRHGEWVNVKQGDRQVECYIVYP